MTDNCILHESKHIEWSIKNFFNEPDVVDHKLDSAYVPLSDARWFLRIYTNGETKFSSLGYVGLYLVCKLKISEPDVICRFGIKNKDGTEFRVREFKHAFTKKSQGFGYPKLIHRSQLLRFREDVAPNGTLSVFCTFRTMDGSISSPVNIKSSSNACSGGTWTLINDLRDMYFSGLQSDLTITVKNKTFRLHRNIISSRSPVFKSMLTHNMVEKRTGRVEIPDCDPDSFEDFLLFLYTGKFDNVSPRNAVSLYFAADKYDVKDLKAKCASCMIDELSDDVFCDVLHLATIQNEKDLLKAVKDYFINNEKTIITTTKWHRFIEENPLVANQLFIKKIISTNNTRRIKGLQYLQYLQFSILFVFYYFVVNLFKSNFAGG